MITDKEHPMKIDFSLDVTIPVQAHTLTIHLADVRDHGDYYETALKEAIEDMVSAFLRDKIEDIIDQVSLEVEDSMMELNG